VLNTVAIMERVFLDQLTDAYKRTKIAEMVEQLADIVGKDDLAPPRDDARRDVL
jgi:hypothetical protein